MSDHKWKAGDRFALLTRYNHSHDQYVLPVGQTGTVISPGAELYLQLDSDHRWAQDKIWLPARVLSPQPHQWKDGDRFILPYQHWMGEPHHENYKLKDATGVFHSVRSGDKYANITLDPGFWSIPNPSIPLDNLQYLPPKEKKAMNDLQHKVWSYLMVDGHAQRKTALKELSSGGFFTDEAAASAEAILEGWVAGWEREETFCNDGISRFRNEFFGPKTTGEVDVWFELGFRIPAEVASGYRDSSDKSVDGFTIVEEIKSLVRDKFGIEPYSNCYYGETGLYPTGSISVTEVEDDSYITASNPPRA